MLNQLSKVQFLLDTKFVGEKKNQNYLEQDLKKTL